MKKISSLVLAILVLWMSACSTDSSNQPLATVPQTAISATPTISPNVLAGWQKRVVAGYPLIKAATNNTSTGYHDENGSLGFLLSTNREDVLALDISEHKEGKVLRSVSVYPVSRAATYGSLDSLRKTTFLATSGVCDDNDFDCATPQNVEARHQEAQTMFDSLMKARFGNRWPF